MTQLTSRQRALLLLFVLLQSTIPALVVSGLIPVHMDKITAAFGVGRGTVGTVLAVASFLSAGFAFSAGFVAERVGNLRVLLVGVGGQSVAIAVFAFAGQPWMALVLVILFFGLANTTCVSNAVSVEFFSSSRKRGVNLLHAVNGLGKFAGPLVALALAGTLWRWGFLAVGIYGLLLLAPGFVLLGQGVHSKRLAGMHDEGVLHRPLYWVCSFGFVLIVGAEFGVSAWLPEYLRVEHSFSERLKTIMQTLLLAGLVSGRFATVFIGYRLSHRRILTVCCSCALFILPVVLFRNTVLTGVCLFLTGIASSAAWPTHFAYITRFFPNRQSALTSGAGLANTAGYTVAFLLGGWISEVSLTASVLMGLVLMTCYAALFVGLHRYETRSQPTQTS